jgi:hypothetical protein
VAWPLELIIDSNAIKQYNQVYLNTCNHITLILPEFWKSL